MSWTAALRAFSLGGGGLLGRATSVKQGRVVGVSAVLPGGEQRDVKLMEEGSLLKHCPVHGIES